MSSFDTPLHANIKCYVNDLLNSIDSPLTRENIEMVLSTKPLAEVNAAWDCLAGALLPARQWDNPLIDSLFKYIETLMAKRQQAQGDGE